MNDGLNEMPSPAQQATPCPAPTSPPVHTFHMDTSMESPGSQELHKIYVRSYTEVDIV